MTATTVAPGRRTGLVVLVPETEPAHVTVLYPWFRAHELTPELLAELGRVAGACRGFDVVPDGAGPGWSVVRARFVPVKG